MSDELTQAMRRLYSELGVDHLPLTEKWYAESPNFARAMNELSDRHLINCICLAFERSGGPWPTPVKMYPSLVTMIREASIHRRLDKPRKLEGSDWPWGEGVEEQTILAALDRVEGLTMEKLGIDASVFEHAEENKYDPEDYDLGYTADNPADSDIDAPSITGENAMSNDNDYNEEREKKKFLKVFKEQFAQDIDIAQASAVYGGVLAMINDFIKPYEPLLPDWMKSEEFKAALLYLIFAPASAWLETMENEDNLFFVNMARGLSRNTARGAAAHFGKNGGEKAYQLAKKGLAVLNSYIRPNGFGFDMDGNLRPAHQLPDNSQAEEIERMANEIGDLKHLLEKLVAEKAKEVA